jgi:predicted nucleotidyltransferase
MIDDTDPLLARIVPRLADVSGVAAIALGGSRARGTATEASDYDIGLYFQSDKPLDTKHLLDVVRELVDDPVAAAVTPVGEWGPVLSAEAGYRSMGGRSTYYIAESKRSPL